MLIATGCERRQVVALLIVTCFLSLPAHAKYAGGRGTAKDPYRIATAADLLLLGESPEDYDRHFLLTADIDLGHKVFDEAVIAPDTNKSRSSFQGVSFGGTFDGNGHTISHLTIAGRDYLGLFGQLDAGAEVFDLALEAVEVEGTGDYIGGLVGDNHGNVVASHSTGKAGGRNEVGGLVGTNHGNIATSYTTGTVSGRYEVGGLVGDNWGGIITSYSTAAVSGDSDIAGLSGDNHGSIADCYSTGAASGTSDVGGLVGDNHGSIVASYSTGAVSGRVRVGGLVGIDAGTTAASFWDTKTSGLARSDAGTGKTTAQMQKASTFLDAGWDFVGETANGREDLWWIREGKDYPKLRWQEEPDPPPPPNVPEETESDDLCLVYTAEELNLIGLSPAMWNKHFKLMADIDLAAFDGRDGRPAFNIIAPDTDPAEPGFQGIPFAGVFDGNGHTISHLTVTGGDEVGLFGRLGPGAEVRNLGVVEARVTGSGFSAGALAGDNWGTVANCFSTGTVTGNAYVGGLVGHNDGHVTCCCSTAESQGRRHVGGLVGDNEGAVTQCYSMGAPSGVKYVGGLIGSNWSGKVTDCYSTGTVSGDADAGGLVGSGEPGSVTDSFWDTQSSDQTASAGGTGKTAAQMKKAATFLNAGWDFLGETANGAADIWWIREGKDYPHLWWEGTD